MFTHGWGFFRQTSLVFATSGMVFAGLETRAGDQPQARLPAAVRKTLKLEAAKADVEDIQKLKNGRSAVWEIDVIQSGKSYELHIAADGTLIHKQLEGKDADADEEAEERSSAKSKTVGKKEKSPTKSSAKDDDDEDMDENTEAKARSDRQDDEEQGEDDGEELSIRDLPKAVRNALNREAAGGEIEEIERERENGVTIYEATVEFDSDDKSSADDKDDAEDEEEREEEADEDDDEEIVYEFKFSERGVLLSKILVEHEDENDEEESNQ